MRKLFYVPVVALALAGAGFAIASDRERDDDRRHAVTTASATDDGPRLTVAQIAERFAAMGYQVRKVESEDGVYEVSGVDVNGLRVEAYVDPRTGEILRDRKDD